MNVAMVAANLTKWIAYGGVRVMGVYGYNSQATDRYLQFFESPTVAANAIPTSKGILFPSGTGASYGSNAFGAGGLYLSSLLAAISTVPEKYTAAGAGGGIELTLLVDTAFPVVAATSVVGDLTTGVASLQVLSDVLGIPHSLKRVEVQNGSGASSWLVIQSSDIALTTDSTTIPLLIPDGLLKTFNFGPSGFSPFRNDLGAIKQGINLRLSTTASRPYIFDAVANYNIRAIYE